MPRKNQAVSLFAQIFRVDVDRQARLWQFRSLA
jgi:hypothetical protein